MKSKAHMKKCLELGVSVTSVEDADAEEAGMNQTEHIRLSIFYRDEPKFDKYWALYVALVRFLRNNYRNEKQEPPLCQVYVK